VSALPELLDGLVYLLDPFNRMSLKGPDKHFCRDFFKELRGPELFH
jgi:hypothetical protein